MSALVLVPGLRIRHEPTRAAAGKLPWGVFADVIVGGKRKARAKFFATEAEAIAAYPSAAAEVRAMKAEAADAARLMKGLNVPVLPQAPKGVTLFEPLVTTWLTDHVKALQAPGTWVWYKSLVDNHLLPTMRTWPVTDEVMSRQRLKQFLKIELRERGVSLQTRKSCQAVLSAFCKWALGELPARTFTINPASGLGGYVRDTTEKDIELGKDPNPMTRVQVEAFLAWIKDHREPWLYAFFLWLVDEGSRLGEVCALKRDRLDFERGRAHILETYSSGQRRLEIEAGIEGWGEKPTKTHRRNQYNDVSPRVLEEMEAQLARVRRAWLAKGRYGKEPVHCFVTSTLGPRRPCKAIYDCFADATTAVGATVGQTGRPFTIHDLRATFATLSIMEGKPVGWVAMMLGHSSENTLRKHYYRWIRMTEANILATGAK